MTYRHTRMADANIQTYAYIHTHTDIRIHTDIRMSQNDIQDMTRYYISEISELKADPL